MNEPRGVSVTGTSDGTTFLVADSFNNRVRRVAAGRLTVQVPPLNVRTGTSGTVDATVTNGGQGFIAVKNATVAPTGAFASSGGNCAGLRPGQSCQVPVTFTAKTPGAQNGTLTVTADTGQTIPTDVVGNGLQPALKVTGVGGGDALAATQTFSAGVQSVVLEVANSGTWPLTARNVALTSSQTSGVTTFFQGPGTTCTLPALTLGVGQRCAIEVDYRCASGTGAVTFTTDDAPVPQTVTHTVALGVDANPANQVACGHIAFPAVEGPPLTAVSVGMGQVRTGTTSPAVPVTVENFGQSPVSIAAIRLSGSAELATSPASNCANASLAPGQTCVIDVTFTPATTGDATATLSITDSGGTTIVANFSGTGVQPQLQISENGAAVTGPVTFSGPNTSRTLTLTNVGTFPLQGSAAAPAGASVFTIGSTSTCTAASFTIPAGQSCNIVIGYACGTASATLAIVADDAPSPQQVRHDITLQPPPTNSATCAGIGGGGPPTIDVTFPTVEEGSEQPNVTVSLVNTSQTQVTIGGTSLSRADIFTDEDFATPADTDDPSGARDCGVESGPLQAADASGRGGGTCAVEVTFTGTGVQTGTLTVTDSGGNTILIVRLHAGGATGAAVSSGAPPPPTGAGPGLVP